MNFSELTNSIVARHHSYLRKVLPAISISLDELVTQLKGNENVSEAQSLFKKIRNKIEVHLNDEETVLFPTGCALELGQKPPKPDFDLLERLASMEEEHHNCGNALKLLLQMLSELPDSELQSKLKITVATLCDDMDEHVKKENEEVHPRFMDLVKAAAKQC